VEPVTHALTSLALARAGQRRLPRMGTAIVLTAGLAPDLDYATYFGGAGAFLRFHRGALHSVVGAAFVACVTAAAFWAVDAKRKKLLTAEDAETAEKTSSSMPLDRNSELASRVRFLPALVAGVVGAAGHVLLDVGSGTGVQLLWPFRAHRYAWNIVANLDPWILIVLATGLLIPPLLRLISEEIGERKKTARGRTAAIVTLAIVAAYLCGRAALHSRAIDLLEGTDYHGRAPLSAGAFPSSTNPFAWRGVVITDNTTQQAEVALGTGPAFDPERSQTQYKPEDSPALEAGQRASASQTFLKYARLPFAHIGRLEDGYRFELHDLQFAADDLGLENVFVRVDLDSGLHVIRQGFFFAASPNP
jgi:membrane-bound metal-dependent hydrolase YbcI (DUF457 family)